MIYKLTLTYDERMAIDWVGHRYSHGDDLAKLLDDSNDEWTERKDIEFTVPEHIAWDIQAICEEDNLTCFSDEFKLKLIRFCEGIV
jgi:hypothetical protein